MAFKSNMLFDVLANILSKKSKKMYLEHIKSENFKDAAPYMIRRYLSMHQDERIQSVITENLTSLERMSDTALYWWLLLKIPKQSSTFIRYLR